ncbi:MAG TPA: hypothetical protein DCS63_05715 [Elusimicrobia bacterium]|nr:hypothetical protein [Elusimicrobiota bacterium]
MIGLGRCLRAARRGDRISKTLPEPDACVSAEGEAGKREHGVRDAVFAFLSPRCAEAVSDAWK